MKKIILTIVLCFSILIALSICFSKKENKNSNDYKAFETQNLSEITGYVESEIINLEEDELNCKSYFGVSNKKIKTLSSVNYGYEYLNLKTQAEKNLYKDIYEALKAFDASSWDAVRYSYSISGTKPQLVSDGKSYVEISVSSVKTESGSEAVKNVFDAVVNDNPQFFWLSNTFYTKYDNIYLGVINSASCSFINGATRKAYELKIEEEIQNYLNLTANSETDYEKVLTIYNALMEKLDYPTTSEYAMLETGNTTDYNPSYHNIYGAFTNSTNYKVVCEGFAESLKVLLDRLGIESVLVTGEGGTTSKENHEWNLIKLDGKWYYTDLTWDDNSNKYTYFLSPESALFTLSHIADNRFSWIQNLNISSSEHEENEFVLEVGTILEEETNVYFETSYNPGMYANAKYKVVAPRQVAVISSDSYSIDKEGKQVYKTICTPNFVTKNGNKVLYGVTDIYESAYENAQINKADLKGSYYLQNISDKAFKNTDISELLFEENIKYIGNEAFSGCNLLSSFTFNNQLEAIGDKAFYDSGVNGAIDFSSTKLKSLGDEVFGGCNLSSITLSDYVNNITGLTFFGITSIKNIDVSNNPNYENVNSVLYTKDLKTLVYYPSYLENDSYQLLESTETIGKYAFANQKYVINLTCNDLLQTVGSKAFYNAKIENILNTKNIKYVLDNAFLSSLVTKITFDNLLEIDYSAFADSSIEVLFNGNAPVVNGGDTIETGSSIFYFHLNNKAFWDIKYDYENSLWCGVKAYYIYDDITYSKAWLADDFDTKDVLGSMVYDENNKIWQANNYAITKINSEVYQEGSNFEMNATVNGNGGIVFLADDNDVTITEYCSFYVKEKKAYLNIYGNIYSVDINANETDDLKVLFTELGEVRAFIKGSYGYVEIFKKNIEIKTQHNMFGFVLEDESTISGVSLVQYGENILPFAYERGTFTEVDNKLISIADTLALVNKDYDGTSKFTSSIILRGNGGFVLAHKRENETSSYYQVGIKDGYVIISKISEQKTDALVYQKIAEYDSSKEYLMSLERFENNITIYLNNEIVVEYHEESNERGTGFGLWASLSSLISEFAVKYKNDYSKIDENNNNFQGIYFTLDEESMKAYVGHHNDSSSDFINNAGYQGANYGTVRIPQYVRKDDGSTYDVIGVAENAFNANEYITSIILPSTIDFIGENAFNNCANLVTITFKGNAPTNVSDEAFGTYEARNPNMHIETLLSKDTLNTWNISHDNPLFKDVIAIYSDDSFYQNYLLLDEYGYDIQGIKYTLLANNTLAVTTSLKKCETIYIANIAVLKGKCYQVSEVSNKAFQYDTTVKEISFRSSDLNKGVTVIRKQAFSYCSNLETIILNDNIQEVEDYAFESCTKLSNLDLSNIKEISQYLCANCSSLNNVILSNSLTKIGTGAFSGASSLRSIILPNSLTSLGQNAFLNCINLESVTLSKHNRFSSISTSAFEGCVNLKDIEIPSNIKSINAKAFYNCSELTELSIPSSVTTIRNNAFDGCTKLKSVYFEGDFPKTFEADVFGKENGKVVLYYDNKYLASETSKWNTPFVNTSYNSYLAMYSSDSYEGKNGVIMKHLEKEDKYGIWSSANGEIQLIVNTTEGYANSLLSSIVPSKESIVEFAATVRVNGNGSKENSRYGLIFAASDLEEDKYFSSTSSGYFFGLTKDGNVSLIKINKGIEEIISSAYVYPEYQLTGEEYNLRVRRYGSTNTICCYVNEVKFYEVVDNTYTLGSYGFEGTEDGTVFSDISLTEVGDEILSYTSEYGLDIVNNYTYDSLTMFNFATDITFNNNISGGIVFAYDNNTYYKLVAKNEDSEQYLELYKVIEGKEQLLHSENIVNIFKENTKASIKVVWNASSDIDCYINSKWVFKYIDSTPLTGSSYGIINLDNNSLYNTTIVIYGQNISYEESIYSQLDPITLRNTQNILFELDDETMTASIADGTLTKDKVVVIPNVVRVNNNVYLVTKIFDDAFMGVETLETVLISDNVKEIGSSAFKDCINLSNVTLSKSLKELSSHAFENTNIKSINLPEDLEIISEYAFFNAKLEGINIPENVYSIGNGAFAALSNNTLYSIILSSNDYFKIVDGVLFNSTMEELILFPRAKKLYTYEVPETVKVIDSYAFSSSMLKEIIIPNSVIDIGEGAFANNNNLYRISLPNIEVINSSLFENCSSLKSIILPENLVEIGKNAFLNTGLTSVIFNDSLKTIESFAFANTNLKEVIFNEGLENVYENAFASCELEYVKLSSTIKKFDFKEFAWCSNLCVEIASNNDYFKKDNYGVIYNNDYTKLLLIPSGLKFEYYTTSDSLELISSGAIGSNSIKDLYVPGKVKLEDNAFINYLGTVLVTDQELYQNVLEQADAVNIESVQVSLEEILVYTLPDHFEFTKGDEVDFTGLSYLVKYYDADSDSIHYVLYDDVSLMNLSDVDNKVLEEEVTITHFVDDNFYQTSFKVYFNETRTPTSVVIAEYPEKTEYLLNEFLELVNNNYDLNGLVVVLNYDDDTTKLLDKSEYTITSSSSEIGTSVITVTYETVHGSKFETSFTVLITEKYITDLYLEYPTKLEYEYGEEFDFDGLQIVAIYNNGEVIVLEYGVDYYVSGFDNHRQGAQDLEIIFNIDNNNLFVDTIGIVVNYLEPEKTQTPILIARTQSTLIVKSAKDFDEAYQYEYSYSYDGTNWSEYEEANHDYGFILDNLAPGTKVFFKTRLMLNPDAFALNAKDQYLYESPVLTAETLKDTNPNVPTKPIVTTSDTGLEGNKVTINVALDSSDLDIINALGIENYLINVVCKNKTTGAVQVSTGISKVGEVWSLSGIENSEIEVSVSFGETSIYEASSYSEKTIIDSGKYTPVAVYPEFTEIDINSIRIKEEANYEYYLVNFINSMTSDENHSLKINEAVELVSNIYGYNGLVSPIGRYVATFNNDEVLNNKFYFNIFEEEYNCILITNDSLEVYKNSILLTKTSIELNDINVLEANYDGTYLTIVLNGVIVSSAKINGVIGSGYGISDSSKFLSVEYQNTYLSVNVEKPSNNPLFIDLTANSYYGFLVKIVDNDITYASELSKIVTIVKTKKERYETPTANSVIEEVIVDQVYEDETYSFSSVLKTVNNTTGKILIKLVKVNGEKQETIFDYQEYNNESIDNLDALSTYRIYVKISPKNEEDLYAESLESIDYVEFVTTKYMWEKIDFGNSYNYQYSTDSITIENKDNLYEFSLDGITWTDGTFEDLNEGGYYKFLRRYKEDETHFSYDGLYDETDYSPVFRTQIKVSTLLENYGGKDALKITGECKYGSKVSASLAGLDDSLSELKNINFVYHWYQVKQSSDEWDYDSPIVDENGKTITSNSLSINMFRYYYPNNQILEPYKIKLTLAKAELYDESIYIWDIDEDYFNEENTVVIPEKVSYAFDEASLSVDCYYYRNDAKGTIRLYYKDYQYEALYNGQVYRDDYGYSVKDILTIEYRLDDKEFQTISSMWDFITDVDYNVSHKLEYRFTGSVLFEASDTIYEINISPSDFEEKISSFTCEVSLDENSKFVYGENIYCNVSNPNTENYVIKWYFGKVTKTTYVYTYPSGYVKTYEFTDIDYDYDKPVKVGSNYLKIIFDVDYDEYLNADLVTQKYVNSNQPAYDEAGNRLPGVVDVDVTQTKEYLGYSVAIYVCSNDSNYIGNYSCEYVDKRIEKANLEKPEEIILDDINAQSISLEKLSLPFFAISGEETYYKKDCIFNVSNNNYLKIDETGVSYSTDNGVTWKQGNDLIIKHQKQNGLVKIGKTGLEFSTDSGNTWASIDNITINFGSEVTIYQTFVEAEYSYDGKTWLLYEELPVTDLENGKEYTIYARYKETNTYHSSDIEELTFTTNKLSYNDTSFGDEVIKDIYKSIKQDSQSLSFGPYEVSLPDWFTDYLVVDYPDSAVIPDTLKALFSTSIDGKFSESLILNNLKPQTEYTVYFKFLESKWVKESLAYEIKVKTLKESRSTTPSAPVIEEYSDNYLVIRAVNNAEFIVFDKDGKAIDTSGNIILNDNHMPYTLNDYADCCFFSDLRYENLKPNEEYSIYSRYVETTKYLPTDLSKVTSLTTDRSDWTFEEIATIIDGVLSMATEEEINKYGSAAAFIKKSNWSESSTNDKVSVEFLETIEYAFETYEFGYIIEGFNSVNERSFMYLDPATTYSVKIYIKENDTHYDSMEVSLGSLLTDKLSPNAPSAPQALVITETSVELIKVIDERYEYEYYVVLGEHQSYKDFEESSWTSSPTITGLVKDTIYSFFTRIKENGKYYASPASLGYVCKTTPMILSGSIDLGFAESSEYQAYCYGSLLTITTNVNQMPVVPTYHWYRDGVMMPSETHETYKVKESDIGHNIKASMDGDVSCSGSLMTKEYTITKIQTAAPLKFVEVKVVGTTITVTNNPLMEFSIDGINYEAFTGETFTYNGLDPEQTYTLLMRVKETDTNLSSEAISLVVTTAKNPQVAPEILYTSGDTSIELVLEENVEYSIYGDNITKITLNINSEGVIDSKYLLKGLKPAGKYTISAYRVENELYALSDVTTITFNLNKLTQEAPTEELTYTVTDSSITMGTILNKKLCYSINGGEGQYSNIFTNLKPNTEYEISYWFSENAYYKASDKVTITIKTDKGTPNAVAFEENIKVLDTSASWEGNINHEYYIFEGKYDALSDSLDETKWISVDEVKNLTPDTEYSLLMRIKETEDYYPSVASDPVYFKTLKQYTINFYVSYIDFDDNKVSNKLDETISRTYYFGEEISSISNFIPELPSNLKYSYTFTSWTGELAKYAYQDYELYTELTNTYIDYVVKFINDGNEFRAYTRHYQEVVEDLELLAPTKESTNEYDFTFIGWSLDSTANEGIILDTLTLEKDLTYYAIYSKAKVGYSVTYNYKGADGTDTTTVIWYKYGDIYEGFEINDCYLLEGEYVFSDWDKSLPKIIDADYEFTAQYDFFEHTLGALSFDEKYHYAVCEYCGFEFKEAHNLLCHEEIPAKCESTGVKKYYECLECGALLNDDKSEIVSEESLIIAKLGHNYQETSYSWDNDICTATKVCIYDSSHIIEETKKGVYVKDTDATCEENEFGHYEVTFDDEENFGSAKTAKNTVEMEDTAKGHDYGNPSYTWSSDYSTCKATRICSRDSSHVETETVSSTSKVTQAQTCENAELTCFEAVFTNPLYNKQLVENVQTKEALNHNYEFREIIWNEFTAKAVCVCANDNSHIIEYDCVITSEITLEATCTETGIKTYTATYGSNTSTKDEVLAINPNNHDLIHHDALAPTCENFGWETYDTCSRCSYSTYQEIKALNHNYEFREIIWNEFTAKAVCVCANDDSHIIEYDCAITSEVTLEPTCAETGIKTYTATYGSNTSTKDEVLAINPNNHNLIHYEALDSTCEDVGWEAYDACSRCSYSTYVEIEAHGHNYEWVVDEKATTENTGLKHKECTYCFDKIELNTIIEVITCLHESIICYEYVAPTCEKAGSKEYYYCPMCEKYYSDSSYQLELDETTIDTWKVIKATGHNYGAAIYEWKSDYSTCTATIICSNDSSHKITETVNSIYVKDTDATCINNEFGHYEAEFSNVLFTNQKTEENSYEVPESLSEHDYGMPSYVWSNDYSTCKATRVCSRDASHIEEETVNAIVTITQKQTCCDVELTSFIAIFNNLEFEKQVIENVQTKDALNHNYEFSKIIWNEFTAKAVYVCSNDNSHIVEYDCVITSEVTLEATCVQTGIKTYTATYEGNIATKDEVLAINPNSHDLIHHEALNPTCEEIGWETYDTCSRCDYTTYKELKALGHTYGKVTYTWSSDFSTCTATRVCIIDSHVDSQTVHSQAVITQEQDCDKKELTTFVASFKSEAFDTQIAANIQTKSALGHNYKNPTYSWSGDLCVAMITCSHNKSHFITETVKAVYVKDTDATCEENEYGHYEASFVSAFFTTQSYSEKSIELEGTRLEHIYTEWTTINPPTYKEKGSEERECTLCHNVEKREIDMLVDENINPFKEAVEAINGDEEMAELYSKLYEAIEKYKLVCDKEAVTSEYQRLTNLVNDYNNKVEDINDNHENSSINALGIIGITLTLSLSLLGMAYVTSKGGILK